MKFPTCSWFLVYLIMLILFTEETSSDYTTPNISSTLEEQGVVLKLGKYSDIMQILFAGKTSSDNSIQIISSTMETHGSRFDAHELCHIYSILCKHCL